MRITITAKIQGKNEELLTLSQAGKMLGISRQAILKMINNGWIRAIRLPELFLVPLKDIKKIQKRKETKICN